MFFIGGRRRLVSLNIFFDLTLQFNTIPNPMFAFFAIFAKWLFFTPTNAYARFVTLLPGWSRNVRFFPPSFSRNGLRATGTYGTFCGTVLGTVADCTFGTGKLVLGQP